MSLPLSRRTRPAVLGALVLALAAPAAALANGDGASHRTNHRLVVRGTDTVVSGPCAAGVCALELAGGSFHGSPVGSGAYSGAIKLLVSQAFPNGEGGVCAPVRGRIVLGEGEPDRLVLDVTGDSCQDGAGDPTTSSFTGLARFTVKHGTGAYAKASGSGVAVFAEDAADQEHMTLIGRIAH